MNTPPVAGRWLRVSSDAQDEQNQEQGIDAYIGSHGYATGKTYRAHDKSATKREHRPLLREAIADMRAGVIDVLIIRNTDRIDRTEELGEILRDVKDADGRIESVTEPWLGELSGLPGKIMTAVSEWTNAEYTRKLSVNVSDAHARRRTAGSYVGKAPYGYVIVGFHADGSEHAKPGKCLSCYPDRGGYKTLAVVEGESAIVARIFEEVANGTPVNRMAGILDAEGIKTRGEYTFSETATAAIVANPVYRGK